MHDSSLTNTKAKLTESPRTTRHARRLKEKKIQNSNESNNNRSSSFWHLVATSARALAGNERRARPRRLDHQVGIDKSSKTRPPRMRALRVSVKRVANKTSARARLGQSDAIRRNQIHTRCMRVYVCVVARLSSWLIAWT